MSRYISKSVNVGMGGGVTTPFFSSEDYAYSISNEEIELQCEALRIELMTKQNPLALAISEEGYTASMEGSVGDVIKKIIEWIKNLFKRIKEFFFSSEKVTKAKVESIEQKIEVIKEVEKASAKNPEPTPEKPVEVKVKGKIIKIIKAFPNSTTVDIPAKYAAYTDKPLTEKTLMEQLYKSWYCLDYNYTLWLNNIESVIAAIEDVNDDKELDSIEDFLLDFRTKELNEKCVEVKKYQSKLYLDTSVRHNSLSIKAADDSYTMKISTIGATADTLNKLMKKGIGTVDNRFNRLNKQADSLIKDIETSAKMSGENYGYGKWLESSKALIKLLSHFIAETLKSSTQRNTIISIVDYILVNIQDDIVPKVNMVNK